MAAETQPLAIHQPAPVEAGDFLASVALTLPACAVRRGIEAARDLPAATTAPEAAAALGNGRQVSAQDTVPFALWCAAGNLASYEGAIWAALAGGGDCDTTCAIAGGIAVLSAGPDSIPPAWRAAREPLQEA